LINEHSVSSKHNTQLSPDYSQHKPKQFATNSVLNIKKAQSLQKMLKEAGVLLNKA
jgi:predicted transcriptional regulator